MRDFSKVYRNLLAILPKDLAEDLSYRTGYWAPEMFWYKLSQYINDNITPSSSNPLSIAVYAELCNLSPAQMKEKFEKDGI